MKRELLSLQYWNHVKNNITTNEQISKQHEMQFNQLWLSSSETKYSRLLLSKLQHLVLLRISFHLLDTSFWCAISQITSQNSSASPFFLPALPSRMMFTPRKELSRPVSFEQMLLFTMKETQFRFHANFRSLFQIRMGTVLLFPYNMKSLGAICHFVS